MENEEHKSHEDNPALRWGGLIFGTGFSFVALQSIWSHGLRDWTWVENAALALIAFSFASRTWLNQQNWQSRVFWLAYGGLLGAWIGHQYGWIPGACIIALFVLPATAGKSGSGSAGMQSPLELLWLALALVIAGWFIATTKEWIAFVCIVAVILLLASEKSGRRSMRENLLRLKSVAWIGTLGLAVYWSWKEPSFASVLALVVTPVLWFGNLLMHLSSGERPLALPHPQS